MVTIATFNEPDKARRLKQRLQESGLKADIHNEGHLQTDGIHVEAAGECESHGR